MELIDIREKGERFVSAEHGVVSPAKGVNLTLYKETLDKLSLDPEKVKIGDNFIGGVKFFIESLAANCITFEITHLGFETEEGEQVLTKKKKEFISSKR